MVGCSSGAAVLQRKLLRIPGRVASTGERSNGDVVGPDVVGVSVATELVVGRDHIRPIAADEPDQPARGFVQVGLPEAPWVAVANSAHHVRVVVAQVLPFSHAEDVHGRFQLGRPELTEPSVIVLGIQFGHDDLAHFAARAGDQDHATPFGHRLGHRATGSNRLVVRVRVHRHQGRAVVRRIGGHGQGMLAQPVLLVRVVRARTRPRCAHDRSTSATPARRLLAFGG